MTILGEKAVSQKYYLIFTRTSLINIRTVVEEYV